MNLTATDLTLLTEALTIAEDKLRYTGTTFGEEYHRSMAMADLRRKVQATLDATTVKVEVA